MRSETLRAAGALSAATTTVHIRKRLCLHIPHRHARCQVGNDEITFPPPFLMYRPAGQGLWRGRSGRRRRLERGAGGRVLRAVALRVGRRRRQCHRRVGRRRRAVSARAIDCGVALLLKKEARPLLLPSLSFPFCLVQPQPPACFFMRFIQPQPLGPIAPHQRKRCTRLAYTVHTATFLLLVYPFAACWVWNDHGWASAGRADADALFGCGATDFAGVHCLRRACHTHTTRGMDRTGEKNNVRARALRLNSRSMP